MSTTPKRTRAEWLAEYPHVSESFLRLNASDGAPVNVNGATKPKRASKVPRTRNGGTWTEAEYFQRLRSCLRKMSMYWKPARDAERAARVPMKGPNGQKWAFLCADCNKLHKRKNVNIEHITPAGSLTSLDHLPGFVARLFPEDPAAFAVRCLDCHQKKTNAEREARAASKLPDAILIAASPPISRATFPANLQINNSP